MNKYTKARYSEKIDHALQTRNATELAIGFARYEALRLLTERQFSELTKRNIAGEYFDDMVDELVAKP